MLNPDNDPNLAMSRLVKRSREKLDKVMSKGADPSPASPPAAPPTPPPAPAPAPPAAPAEPPGAPQKLTKLFGKALKFTEKTPPAAPAAPAAAPAAAAPAPAEPPAPTPAPAPAPAGKKGARKVTPAPVDAGAIAREAATAATNAAMQTIRGNNPPADPLADLTATDRRDYEIASHLAKMDPRYKDAPRIILEHVRMADDYATNWERANPGKVFDAGDEEHNEFYAKLARPWSPEEFTDAAIDMRAEQKAEQKAAKLREEQGAEMAGVKESQGRVELAPVVDQHFANAAMALAEQVDPALHQALGTKGWDALSEADPVTAEVMSVTLNQMHPFIEAAVQIDDPHQRFKLDLKKPAHQQWNQVVTTGEANLVGMQLEDGRVFAKRADYVKMSPDEQARHWFLTQEMIVQGAVEYAAAQVKAVSAQQKERLAKMGFARTGTPAPAGSATPATPPPAAPPARPAAPAPDKPVSPSTGSGAKIDQAGGNPLSKEGQVIQFFSKARGTA